MSPFCFPLLGSWHPAQD